MELHKYYKYCIIITLVLTCISLGISSLLLNLELQGYRVINYTVTDVSINTAICTKIENCNEYGCTYTSYKCIYRQLYITWTINSNIYTDIINLDVYSHGFPFDWSNTIELENYTSRFRQSQIETFNTCYVTASHLGNCQITEIEYNKKYSLVNGLIISFYSLLAVIILSCFVMYFDCLKKLIK